MADVEELIVVALTFTGPGGSGLGTDVGYNMSAYPPEQWQILQNMGYYPPSFQIKIKVPEADLPQARQAALILGAAIARVDTAIKAVPNNAQIQLQQPVVTLFGTHTAINTNDLKNIWANTHWTLTALNYNNGREGKNIFSAPTSIAEVEINFNAVLGYNAHPNGSGLNYIVLHEIGHNVSPGYAAQVSNNLAYYNSHGYSTVGYGPGDPLWNNNEQVANQISRDLNGYLGLPYMTAAPTYGY